MQSKYLSENMIYLALAALWLGFMPACSKAKKPVPAAPAPAAVTAPLPVLPTPDLDTLRIQDNFANAPFLLDSISFAGVQKLMGKNLKIIKKPTRNNFIPNQTDTLITLTRNRSHITLYAVSSEPKFFFKDADIKDPLPIFQHALKVGQHKAQVKKLFPALSKQAHLPDNIEIAAGEGADFIYLKFKNDVLQRVEYKPYLD